jgi:hypothetical protein
MQPKRVKPGSKNSSSAKFEKPSKLSATTKANNSVKEALTAQKKTEDVYRKTLKKGFFTQAETEILKKRLKTRKPAI